MYSRPHPYVFGRVTQSLLSAILVVLAAKFPYIHHILS